MSLVSPFKSLAKPLTLVCALALFAAPALADKIVRTDGKVIDDVKVTSDGITEVKYKESRNKNKTVSLASDRVLRIEFEKFPRLVDEAEAAVVADDDEAAVAMFDEFVEGQISKPGRVLWAAAYANYRSIEIRLANADSAGVVEKAQQLITNFPDSRMVPQAYLAKAAAEAMAGDAKAAKKTLGALASIVSSKKLSQRWDLECQLGLIANDSSMSGDDARDALATLYSAASEYPTVKNRVLVVEGETWIAQAEKGRGDTAEYLSEARNVFERILKRRTECDNATLAGAYTGLGDAIFYGAGEDKTLMAEARMHYLRVVIVYADQVQYVPKCLFQAMVASNVLEDNKKKADMKRELRRRYPNSPYAAKASKY